LKAIEQFQFTINDNFSLPPLIEWILERFKNNEKINIFSVINEISEWLFWSFSKMNFTQKML